MQPNDPNPSAINVPKKPAGEAVSPAPGIAVPMSHVVLDFGPREIGFEAPQPTFTPPPHTTITPSLVPPRGIATPATPVAAVPATPAIPPTAAYTPPSSLSRTEQIALFTKDLTDLNAKKEALRAEIATLSVEQQKEEGLLAPILKKENELQEAYEAIEQAEASATTAADKRKSEMERFEQETKRQALVSEKFAAMEKSEKIKESIAQKEAIYKSLAGEETQLKTKIHEIDVEAQRKVIHDELEGVVKTRVEAESKVEEATKEKANAERLLNETTANEKSIEESAHATAQQMSSATSLQDERTLAEARAKLEMERHHVEETRWHAEDAMAAIDAKVAEATRALEAIKAHEAELFAKLQTIK